MVRDMGGCLQANQVAVLQKFPIFFLVLFNNL